MFHSEHHNHCPQHHHPHQEFFVDLMREFDPKDPANKHRTFDKMVAAANRKHLNPGEQSFHYYIDKTDNKVHGFLAVGNINDRLPHIIIADNNNGKESALERIEKTLNIVYTNSAQLDSVMAKVEELMEKVDYPENFENFINDLNEVKERVDALESRIPESLTPELVEALNNFVQNNQEFFTEDNTTLIETI